MAKKKTAKPPVESPENDAPNAAATEELHEGAEQSPKVRKAADAVSRAKAEFEKAQALYEKVRREATDKLKDVREKTLGDLIDGVLQAVRKRPGLGVIIAATLGFLLGRKFKR